MPGAVVFGGAGFIGSNLVDELMSQGHEVLVFDNFSEGKRENLQRWKGNEKLQGPVLNFLAHLILFGGGEEIESPEESPAALSFLTGFRPSLLMPGGISFENRITWAT